MRCVSILKNSWLWTAVDRKNKKLVSFEVGKRKTKYFENLSSKIEHIEPKKYASDRYKAVDIIDHEKRLFGKSQTYTVERMNRLLRHYLARFARKIYCYSKSISMIVDSVFIFSYRLSPPSIWL